MAASDSQPQDNKPGIESSTLETSTDGYEVKDLRESGAPAVSDWMTRLLMNKEFQMVPAQNLYAIFSKLSPVTYLAGDKVIEQGKPGEFFFIIASGRCAVTREMPQNRGDIKLAELSVGDTFGEEALITGAKRAATITMLTNGSVMRLTKEDFSSLLSEPIVTTVDKGSADSIVASGGKWLNVDFKPNTNGMDPSSTVAIPMPLLRLKLDQLDQKCHYVVVSSTPSHSRSGAHILRQQGFEVSVLSDKIEAPAASAPAQPAAPKQSAQAPAKKPAAKPQSKPEPEVEASANASGEFELTLEPEPAPSNDVKPSDDFELTLES